MAVNETILIDFTDILNNNPSDAYVAVYVNSSNNVGNGRNLSKRYIKKSLLTSLLLQTNGVNNTLQSVLNLIAGSNITLTPNGSGGVTIASSGSGSSILLQTEGVDNPVQNLLNLVAGTNMTITDDGAGNITFDATGGSGPTITANNGLTKTVNNIKLGGTLLEATTIVAPGLTNLTLEGHNADDVTGTLVVTNDGSDGRCIYINKTNGGLGIGVFQTDNNSYGIGVGGQNVNTGIGISVSDSLSSNYVSIFIDSRGTNSFPIVIERYPDSVSNAIETMILLKRGDSTTAPFVGMGSSINFQLLSSTYAFRDSNKIISKWTDATNATRTSQFEITSVNLGAAESTIFTLKGTGQLLLNKYGIGTFVNSPAYSLGVDASGNVIEFTPSTGGGTVTSVDLTMPPAFSVTGNPITTAGTLAVAAAGLSTQYIRGDGQLANFPSSGGGGSSINYYLNGSVSQGTFGGVAFREMSKTAIFGAGTNFSINADGYIQSFITDANDPNQLLIPAGNWNFEMYFNASSGGGSPTFYVELYKWDGAALTLIASSSANPEGITNGTTVDLYVTALAVPSTVLAATDRLAVRVWVNHSGRTITLHTEDNNLCEVLTTFSTGLTALNGLTDQVQLLAVGTSGTDFNISSATATHTFNIPSSSALNRGLLLAADWSIFNGKQNALTDTKSVKIVSNNVELDGDLATPLANYVYGTNGTGVKGWKPDPSSGGTIGFKVPTITEIMSTTLALTNSIEYVASVDKLYVANGNNNVNIFNATTGELLSTVLLTQALRVRYISSINEIWATSVNVASITRISPTTNASLGTITIGIEANGYDILEISSTKVYVSITTNGAQKIQIINPTTLTWVSNITTSITNFASGMALNSNPSSAQNGIVILVTSGAGSVNLINSTTNIVIATVTPGGMSNCFEVAYSAADDKYYIASQGNGRIISLNITGLTTLTLDKIKNNAFLTISLQIDDTNDLLIINQVANSSSNLANMCHFIKKSTFESLYNIITPAAGGGGSRAGSVKLDLPNKRVFLTGRSAGSLPVVTLKY